VGLRSPKTLRKHFREDLDHGRTGADIRVRKTLYEMATSGKYVTATIYWLSRQAGWQAKAERDTRLAIPDFIVALDEAA